MKCRQIISTYFDQMINERQSKTFPFEEDLSSKTTQKTYAPHELFWIFIDV